MSGWLVGYDVPGIQRYVFAPVRPMDIMGGSALLEQFAEEARGEIAPSHAATAVYSGGGGGLFLTESAGKARDLEEALRARLSELTAGAVALSCASVPLTDDLPSTRVRLRRQLQDERLRRALDRPTETLLPSGTRPDEVCNACGLEPGDRQSPVGSGADQEVDWIGAQCAARRDKGRRTRVVEMIRDLFPKVESDDSSGRERLPRGAVLAALYLDGDGLGRRLGEIGDLEELEKASRSVSVGIAKAIAAASTATGSPPTLAPVVGGDDVVLFCDARRAATLLHRLWDELEQEVHLEGAAVRFSAAVVLSDPYLPLRIVFDEARRALDQAKRQSRRRGSAHVELRSLVPGRLHPGRGKSLTGSSLPRDALWGSAPSLRALLLRLNAVTRAQRSGIANDLEETSAELRELLLDERAARDREHDTAVVGKAIGEARALAATVGASSHEMLRAALALHSLWGDASP